MLIQRRKMLWAKMQALEILGMHRHILHTLNDAPDFVGRPQ